MSSQALRVPADPAPATMKTVSAANAPKSVRAANAIGRTASAP